MDYVQYTALSTEFHADVQRYNSLWRHMQNSPSLEKAERLEFLYTRLVANLEFRVDFVRGMPKPN